MRGPLTPEFSSSGMDQPPSLPSEPKRKRWVTGLIIIIVILLLLAIWRHIQIGKRDQGNGKAIPVVTATAHLANVPVFVPALGAVTPTATITVKTQINGQMLDVYFQEGQIVKAGDLLAEIDPRPYEAQLIQNEGQLERDQAALANAIVDLTRYQKLYPQGAVSQQTYATQQSLVQQLQGTVKLDKGLIQGTQLDLIYAHITSPVNGRIGLRLIDPGNFVQTTDTNGLFVIATMQPITVVFPIPEDNLSQIRDQLRGGKTLAVEAYDRTQNTLLATGNLMAVDSQIDPTTGTVKLKALFPNEENKLFPQQFVNIQLLVNTLRNVVVIPTSAIQYGPKGAFVFVVNNKYQVNMRPVSVGVTNGNDTVVKSGVGAGEVVVTIGSDKLSDGASVITSENPGANFGPASPPGNQPNYNVGMITPQPEKNISALPSPKTLGNLPPPKFNRSPSGAAA